MKTLNIVLKVLSALAAIAGIVYLIATYGDQIVEWAKKMMAKCPCMCDSDEAEETAEEAPAEEEAAEEAAAPAEEEAPAAEEAPVVEDNAPVADEEDFEA